MLKRSVPSIPKTCHACSRNFEDGEIVFSVLLEAKGDKWERRTYCGECRAKCEECSGALSIWHGRFSAKPVKKKLPPEMVLDLLKRLVDDPRWKALANLMAWHLVRRKYLRHVSSDMNGGETMNIFTASSTDERFRIPSINPNDEDIRKFSELLDEIDELER